MKCFELINELDKKVKFKDIQAWLKARGVAAKSHFHTLYPDEEKELRRAIIRGDLGKETADAVRALLAERKRQKEKPPEPEPPKAVVVEPEPEPEPEPVPPPKPVEKPAPAEDRGTAPGQLPLRSDSRSAPAMTRREGFNSGAPRRDDRRPSGGYAGQQRPSGGYGQRPGTTGGWQRPGSSPGGARPGGYGQRPRSEERRVGKEC